ncbi:MAG: zinc ribbon domain-containing protein [Promethearchaeota archaeon]
MKDFKDYTYLFPKIGSIISLIAFLTPAAYFTSIGSYMYSWMWGLLSTRISGYSSYFGFTLDQTELIISLISSIIVIISMFFLYSAGNSYKKYGYYKSWLSSSIMLIIGTIIWMVALEIYSTTFSISFWTYVNPGFGVIGIFLGGVISIIGHFIAKSPEARKKLYSTKDQKATIPYKQPNYIGTYEGKTTSYSPNFCPECGMKILKPDQKFCTNCGQPIESLSL